MAITGQLDRRVDPLPSLRAFVGRLWALHDKGTTMTPEQSIVATAVHSWTLNVERADKLFSGLSEGRLLQEVAPGRNRLIYLWGHLIAVHDAMAPLLGLGERLHPELDVIFLTEADKQVAVLPTAADLKHHWDEVHGRLLAGFRGFTASDWARKHTALSDEDFDANPLRNRLAVLLSRANHLSYHLGQAALAPK
jgi:DinB superfamily